jgi:putative ABC transport system permease protein
MTLAVLMIGSSYFDTAIGKNPPISKHDRMLFLNRVQMLRIDQDTVYQIDSSMIDGGWVFDSTFTVAEETGSNSNSSAGYDLLDTYLTELPSVDKQSIYYDNMTFDVYLKSQRLTLRAKGVDADYWNIFDFEYLEGTSFGQGALDRNDLVGVISKTTGDEYFGDYKSAMGQDIVLDGVAYKVIGVVEDVVEEIGSAHANIYIPHSHVRADAKEKGEFQGGWGAVFFAKEGRTQQDISDEIASLIPSIQLPDPDRYNKLILHPMTIEDGFARNFVQYNDDLEGMRRKFFVGTLVLFLMFVLLPAINLININLTRIFERSAEIGVRKAFGATTMNLLLQFVFENTVLTFIGGILGVLLSFVGIFYINKYQLIPYVTLDFNPIVFFYAFLICLLFGIVSGIYPSLRMSRLSIINALKSNNR